MHPRTPAGVGDHEEFGFDLTAEGNPVRLGAGGAGTTYRGWVTLKPRRATGASPLMKQPAALKKIVITRESASYSYRREAMLLGSLGDLNDPRLVRFLSMFIHEGFPIIATELVEGKTMDSALRQLSPERSVTQTVLEWCAQLAGALESLEKMKVVHKDIKPSNVMIRDLDNLPILIDFGIGESELIRHEDGSTTISRHHFVGSPPFASPEQFCTRDAACPHCAGERCAITSKSDIYSLGSTLWTSLTNEYLWAADSSNFQDLQRLAEKKRGAKVDMSKIPEVPGLKELLQEMLAGRSEQRPSPRQVRERLESLLETAFQAKPTRIDPRIAERPFASRTLKPLPSFVEFDEGKEIAVTLVSVYALLYWSKRTAARIDFDEGAKKPARVTFEDVKQFLQSLNEELLSSDGQAWKYRLATPNEWKLAAGLPLERTSVQRYRCYFSDVGGEFEWCDEGATRHAPPECQPLTFISNQRPRTCLRHHRWPKGVIRLLREPRFAFSESRRGNGARESAPD